MAFLVAHLFVDMSILSELPPRITNAPKARDPPALPPGCPRCLAALRHTVARLQKSILMSWSCEHFWREWHGVFGIRRILGLADSSSWIRLSSWPPTTIAPNHRESQRADVWLGRFRHSWGSSRRNSTGGRAQLVALMPVRKRTRAQRQLQRRSIGNLRNNVIASRTLARYAHACKCALQFCRHGRTRFSDPIDLDLSFVEWAGHVWHEGESKSLANDTRSAVLHYFVQFEGHLHEPQRVLCKYHTSNDVFSRYRKK